MRRARNLSVLLILSTLAILLAALVFVLAGNQDRFGPWLRSLSLPAALLSGPGPTDRAAAGRGGTAQADPPPA